jgi:hypothetical protein
MGAQHYPTLTVSRFDYSTPSHQLQFTFSKAMAASLAAGAFDVRAIGSSTALSPAFAYDPTTRIATLTFAGRLPDARYRVTISGAAAIDASGNALDGNADGTPGDDFTFDFFFITGDANHDGAVDFLDLAAMAQNYNTSANTYAQGDFNYDGNVDFLDLAMLAQRYNTALPAAASVAASVVAAPVAAPAHSATAATTDRKKQKPIFSVIPVTRPAPIKPKPKLTKPVHR